MSKSGGLLNHLSEVLMRADSQLKKASSSKERKDWETATFWTISGGWESQEKGPSYWKSKNSRYLLCWSLYCLFGFQLCSEAISPSQWSQNETRTDFRKIGLWHFAEASQTKVCVFWPVWCWFSYIHANVENYLASALQVDSVQMIKCKHEGTLYVTIQNNFHMFPF